MRTSLSASSLLLRISAIVFAVGTLTAFVWYSQVKAQRSVPVAVPEKSPLVISGSKSFSGPVVEVNTTVMTGSKSGIFAPMPASVRIAPTTANISLAPAPARIPGNPSDPFANEPLAPANGVPAAKMNSITPEDPAAKPSPVPQKKRLLMPGSKAPARLLPEREEAAQQSPMPQDAPQANHVKP